MADKPLNDNQVHDLFHRMKEMMHGASGETIHGNTAIETIRRALTLVQLSHLTAAEQASGRLKDPEQS